MATRYLTDSTKALERMIALIRQNSDEPTVDAKYSDADLILRIESAFQSVLTDINSCNDSPLMVRHNITVANGTEVLRLPPNVMQVTEIAKINAQDGTPDWRVTPTSRWGVNPGLSFEGQTLRFRPTWQSEGETLRLTYVPTGDVRLHYGTAASVTGTTVVLAAAPTLGGLDSRDNAYLGCVLRIVSATTNGYVQERTITAYDRSTRTATVEHAWADTPSGTIVYEVVPLYGRLVESVVAARVARDLLRIAGNERKTKLLNDMYVEDRATARRQVQRVNGLLDLTFEHNPDVERN